DSADAEEVVQEVFLALFQHLRKGGAKGNLRGWLFRVAHNLGLKSRMRGQRLQSGGAVEDPVDPNPGPEESLAASQRQTRLLAVVRALPEVDRCCLALRAEGIRYREISAVLG